MLDATVVVVVYGAIGIKGVVAFECVVAFDMLLCLLWCLLWSLGVFWSGRCGLNDCCGHWLSSWLFKLIQRPKHQRLPKQEP